MVFPGIFLTTGAEWNYFILCFLRNYAIISESHLLPVWKQGNGQGDHHLNALVLTLDQSPHFSSATNQHRKRHRLGNKAQDINVSDCKAQDRQRDTGWALLRSLEIKEQTVITRIKGRASSGDASAVSLLLTLGQQPVRNTRKQCQGKEMPSLGPGGARQGDYLCQYHTPRQMTNICNAGLVWFRS